MKNTVGIIMGGGKGTRLFPLTAVRSKPAVPLGGKYRLVDVPISNCINSGITKIFVLTQYNSESLNRHITQTYRFSLFSQGFVDILAAEQTPEGLGWYQGTADAVRQSLRHVLTYRPRNIFILSGDQLYRMDFNRLLQFHQERQAQVSLCVTPVGEQKALQLGILKSDAEGRITAFAEKPKDPRLLETLRLSEEALQQLRIPAETPFLASMGIYLFDTEALVELLADETRLDFGRDILPVAINTHRVFAYPFQGYWEDIGTIASFYEANLNLAGPRPRFNFYDSLAPIYTHPRFLPASRVHHCQIQYSIISEGCEIHGAQIRHSVIGIRSIIREDTELDRTLMLGADYYEGETQSVPIGIGAGSVIRGAILDKNAHIGKGVRILNEKGLRHADGPGYFIREGIVVVPKNGVIPDGTEI